MDEDVEVIIPDTLDEPETGDLFTDFSQVQIQVHGADEAGEIIADPRAFGTEELDDDVEIISDDYPQHLKAEPENISGVEETLDSSAQEYTTIHEEIDIIESNILDVSIPESDKHNAGITEYDIHDIGIPECTNYREDNIEKIPDKDISKYDAVIEEYPDFTNLSIKEEIEPFNGTDYTDFDTNLVEEDNYDELPPEDIYHCNNRIILGSKPCKSTSNVILRRLLGHRDSMEGTDIRKEYLNAVVLLEDCSANMKKTQSFCKDCGTLFATSNDLDAHNMINHSFLVPVHRNVAVKSTTKPPFARKSTGSIIVNNKNIARKSTGSKAMGSTYCNHCNKMFPDNDTLIKHLYELLTVKQFKCNICDAVCKTQDDLTKHSTVHVKSEKMKVKIEKADKTDTDPRKQLKPVSAKKHPTFPRMESEAIPISVLFQCPKCGVHFVTQKNAYNHYRFCESESIKPVRIRHDCDVCKRYIYHKDFYIHKKQHKLSGKFRVIKVFANLSGKTLCKCPNCELYFSDYGIIMHINDCGKIGAVRCPKCNILFPKSRISKHNMMHEQHNLKPKDFIRIQYSIQPCAVKRKIEAPMIAAKKIKLDFSHESDTIDSLQKVKIKKEPNSAQEKSIDHVNFPKMKEVYRLYSCKDCKGCCYNHKHRVIHIKKQCLTGKYARARFICSKCGLQFSSMKYHKTLHQKDFSIEKVTFFDVHSAKRTAPSIPHYPQCQDCKIKFFAANIQAEHICGEDYETCSVCGDKYHNSAYDAHIKFHNLIEGFPKPKKDTKLIPELMKKYKSLNMMWNIVYCCKKCDIITDQYDKAVEHSQGHFNQETSTKNIKCYICNLKIDETCWSKHSELHSQMNINSRDFKILTYNPKKLPTREWFDLFQSLPKEQVKQITEKSMYKHERRFKLKVLKEGRPEFTVYCCSECKVVCRNNEIELHINGICRDSTNICQICSMPFSDISTLRNHQILHMKGMNKEEFRVVAFTKLIRNKTKGTNMELKQQQIGKKQSKTKQPKLVTKIKNSYIKTNNLSKRLKIEVDDNGKYIIHKCRKCKRCIQSKYSIVGHICSRTLKVQKCLYCKENFNASHMEHHMQRHVQLPNFNSNNLAIKLFDPPDEISKGNQRQKKLIPAPSAKSSKISKKYSTKKNKNSKTEVKKLPRGLKIDSDGKLILYKCQNCKCCIQYKRSIIRHHCISNLSKAKKCPYCKELFATKRFHLHMERHKQIPNLNANNIKCKLFNPMNNYESEDKLKSEKVKDSTSSNKHRVINNTKEAIADSPTEGSTCNVATAVKMATVYRCDCGLHYTSLQSIEKHMKTCDSDTDISKEHCSRCGLLFPTDVLVSHLCKHHSKNSQSFNVESYQKNSSLKVESTSKSPVPTKKSRLQNCQIKLYKCWECDIYFINQNTCYKHVKNHRPVNRIQCIKCKLCGLEFTLKSLSIHVNRHHNTEIGLENILVEEYHPYKGKGQQKIDLFVAADKVQSFQVTSSIEESVLSES